MPRGTTILASISSVPAKIHAPGTGLKLKALAKLCLRQARLLSLGPYGVEGTSSGTSFQVAMVGVLYHIIGLLNCGFCIYVVLSSSAIATDSGRDPSAGERDQFPAL